MLYYWAVIMFFTITVHSRCEYQDIINANHILRPTHRKFCRLNTKEPGAGKVQNATAKCIQNATSRHSFYYELSWDPPEDTGTPVIGYRLFILYDGGKYACYQHPPVQRSFVLNRPTGFVYGCGFEFSVTPQPVSRTLGVTHTLMKLAKPCPVEAKLLSLPNIHVSPKSMFSFKATFEEEPIPSANITWYFSPDKRTCKNPRLIKEDDLDVLLTKNRSVLTIVTVERHHVGCYIVSANNGIGKGGMERGYLDLNLTTAIIPSDISKNFTRVFVPVFLAMVFMVALVLAPIWKKRNQSNSDAEKLRRQKVYISHCMDKEDSEKCLLLKFASALDSCGVDVLLDVCSIVNVNNVGGLPRWIILNLQSADKIIIIVTQSYLNKLKIQNGFDGEDNESTHKISAEYNMINELRSEGRKDTKHIIVVCFELKKEEVFQEMKKFRIVPFPTLFDLERDPNFRRIVDNLL